MYGLYSRAAYDGARTVFILPERLFHAVQILDKSRVSSWLVWPEAVLCVSAAAAGGGRSKPDSSCSSKNFYIPGTINSQMNLVAFESIEPSGQ